MKARRLAIGIAGFMGVWVAFGLFLQATGYKPPPDPTPTPAPHVISGTFTLVDDDTAANGCVAPSNGNWSEVRAGADVEIRDGDSWLASGSLGEGQQTVWGQFGEKACAYGFTIGVPTAERYKVLYPGGLTSEYTFEEMVAADWSIGSACCRIVPGG